MASIHYTPSQRKAITYRGGSLLLSAAAGSGKTAALSARITHLVENGITPLSRMLIVTFTKAAASEMRTRIGKALNTAIGEIREREKETGSRTPEDDLRLDRLKNALLELPSVEISTIHAFLYHALKPCFPALGLPHDARIGEETDMKALLGEIMADTVDDFFDGVVETGEGAAPFTELADLIGQVRDTGAIDVELLWLAEALRGRGGNGETLRRFAAILDGAAAGEEALFDTPWGQTVSRTLGDFLAHYRLVADAATEEFATNPKAAENYGPALAHLKNWLTEAETALAEKRYGALGLLFRDFAPPELKSLSRKDATEGTQAFRDARAEMKKEIAALSGKFFAGDEAQFRREAARTAGILRTIAAVLDECFARFASKKRERALLDYGDLEEFGLEVLCDENGEPTPAAEELGARYGAIFIDEYQDTGDAQDRIFRAIAKTVPRFLVGDIKQSIYRFRGADPTVFTSYRRAWETLSPEGEDRPFAEDGGVSLFMSENFRCADSVVKFVNLVSGYVFPHSRIPYEAEDALIYGKNGGVPGENEVPSELCLIDKKQVDEENGEEDPEAAYVAERIRDMIGRYREDGGIVTPEDIAILLRSPSTGGEAYREALRKRGIPSFMKQAEPPGDSPAVMLLLCLLRFADNPLRDVDAAGALRSPLFGMDLSDLMQLREAAGDSPLYLGLLHCASGEWENGSAALREKCEKAAAWVRRQKIIARGMTSDKYMEFLLRDTDFTAMEGIRDSGREQDAIGWLRNLARTWESGAGGGVGGLSGFLEHAEKALENAKNQAGTGEGRGVSIVSIHGSKGLEYPICFLCECGKRRNKTDETRTVLYDRELGLGMYLPEGGGLARCDTFLRRAVSEQIRRDSVEEEMRMLYVAMTRARERLIVTGKVTDGEKTRQKARRNARTPSRHQVLGTSCYLDWILEAAMGAGDVPWLTVTVTGGAGASGEEGASDGGLIASPETAERCAALRNQLTGGYRWAHLSKIASKLTVSRLHPEILDEDGLAETLAADRTGAQTGEEPRAIDENSSDAKKSPLLRPRFLTGEWGDGAERGSATHVFLQFADFAALRREGVEAEMARLVRERYMSPAMAALIRKKQIERFRESALMEWMLRSDMVKREFRFNVQMDAADFTGDEELKEKLRRDGEKITVQGVVDCVFRHPDTGRLILVDYKTDAMPEEAWQNPAVGERLLRSRHENQLRYYGRVCRDLFGEPMEAIWIYSTVLGRVIPIEEEE